MMRGLVVPDGRMMTSYFGVQIAGEVLRIHHVVVDAVLLEDPHRQPAGMLPAAL